MRHWLTSDAPFSLWSVALFDGDGGAGGDGSDPGSAPGGPGPQGAGMNAPAGYSGPSGPAPGSPAGGAQAAGGFAPGTGGRGPSSSSGGGTGPSASSPAGGSQAAGGHAPGTGTGPGTGGFGGGYSGPSPSSPGGGAQAAGGFAPGTGGRDAPGGFGGDAAGGYSGPSPSSPAGGAQAAGGYAPGTGLGGGLGLGLSGGRGPDAASPAGGAQAAAGFADGSRVGIGPSFSPTSPAAGSLAAAGFNPDGSRAPASGRGFSGTGPSQRSAEDQSMGRHTALQDTLAAIRAAEAVPDDPYNSHYPFSVNPNISKMTIAQVMDYQKAMIADQKSRGLKGKQLSTAIGAYQTIASTLAKAVEDLGINPNTTVFSPTVQDQIAISLIDSRAQLAMDEDGVVDPHAFANQLANEWAGFENDTGRSAYEGVGINSANTSFDTVQGLAQGLVDTGAVGTGTSTGTPAGKATAESPAGQQSTPAAASPATTQRSAEDQSMAALAASRSTNPYAGIGVTDEAYGRMQSLSPQPALSMEGRQTATAPTGRSTAAPAGRTTAPTAPATAPAAPAGRGLGRGIASKAIDIGLGMVPGIGTAATIGNIGLTATGRPSIGQMAVDSFMSGHTPATNTAQDNYGGGGSSLDDRKAAGMPDVEDVEAEVEDFGTTYLGWQDTVERPTPQEKWGGRPRIERAV